MKYIIDNFAKMTGGHMPGINDALRHRSIFGFVPHYMSLASESSDANFRQTLNPLYPLKLSPGLTAIRAKNGAYPTVMLANESSSLGKVIYATDLWRFFSDDSQQTDLGIPSGTPTSNAGIDAVIFNSKIVTSHPLDTNLYRGDIDATPNWTSMGGSFHAVVKILKVIEDRCLVLDSSQGDAKPRDRIRIVKSDFSIIDGFAVTSSDYDIQDIGDYEGRYAVIFARKLTSGASLPRLVHGTTVFMWDLTPGGPYDQRIPLPGAYQCSATKNGALHAFTQIGSSLVCYVFEGTGFREVGRLRNTTVSSALLVPKTRISVEGDFFVIVTTSGPLYWNPATGDAFYLRGNVNSQQFKSILIALDPATNTYSRYLSYMSGNSIGVLYSVAMEGDATVPVVSDIYETENQTTNYVMPGAADDTSRAAQSFTASGGLLASATFNLAKEGSPTGSIYAKLYAHSGTFGSGGVPTGTALATSDAIDIATLGTSFTETTFTFSGANKVQLQAGQKYFVAVEYTGGTTSNRPKVGYDGTTPTHAGNAALYFSGVWSAETNDLVFSVTEHLPATGAYSSNYIPVPRVKGTHDDAPMGRAQIKSVEIEYNEKAPNASNSIAFMLTTKDEYESETYTEQTATVKSTTNNSTRATVDAKRAIIELGANATEFAIDIAATVVTPSWKLIIRRIIVNYEPIALQQ